MLLADTQLSQNKYCLNQQTYRKTNTQTNQCYQKHNFLCKGGNKETGPIVSVISC